MTRRMRCLGAVVLILSVLSSWTFLVQAEEIAPADEIPAADFADGDIDQSAAADHKHDHALLLQTNMNTNATVITTNNNTTTTTTTTTTDGIQASTHSGATNKTHHNDQVFTFNDIVAAQRPPREETDAINDPAVVDDDEIKKDTTDHSLDAFQQLAMEQEGGKRPDVEDEEGEGTRRKRKRVINEELVSADANKKERTSRDQLISLAKHKYNQFKLLEAERDKAKLALEAAQHGLVLAKKRVEAFADARENEADMKRKAEERVNTVKMELPLVDQQLNSVRQELERMTSEAELLQTSYHQLTSDYVTLVSRLREHPALERWLEHRLGRSLNPLVRAALRKTSSALMDPLWTGYNAAWQLNSELADEMERHMQQILKHRGNDDGGSADSLSTLSSSKLTAEMKRKYRSEFGWGLWFYLILLFPLLIVFTTVRHFYLRIRKFQLIHYTSLLSLYLCLMSLACFVTSLITKDDVFIILQIRHPTLNTYMVTYHLIAIFVLIALLIRTIFISRDIQHISQCIATMGLMSHYYYHVWRPIILDDMSAFGIYAWVLYAGVFGLIGIERMDDSFAMGSGGIPMSVTDGDTKLA